ncbi:hypothetical protein [Pseudocolwellia sp. HL-MZ7]|jgi:hypothetical protein
MSFNTRKRLTSMQRRRQLNRQKSKTIGRRQSQFIQESVLLEEKNS